MAASKLKIPPIYLLLVGVAFQTAGMALMSTLNTTEEILPAQYGYEILAGIGTSSNIGLLLLMTPVIVEERDRGM